MSVNRYYAKRTAGIDERRQTHSARLEKLVASHWDAATSGGDPVAAGVVLRTLADYAKLWGLDAATRHLVGVQGITADEFATQAAALLEAVGPGPLYEAAGLPAPREPVVVDAEPEEEPWSNIGQPEPWTLRQARALVEAYPQDVSDPSPADDPSAVAPAADDDQDDDEPAEEVQAEVLEAEVVEVVVMPPGQRRIDTAGIIDENGVPLRRAYSVNRYDPLAAYRPGGRRQFELPDPMPTIMPPPRG